MKKSKLDFQRFFPEVYQAVAGSDYTVYVYMNDGAVRLLDMKPLIQEGGVFSVLQDKDVFKKTLTILNDTVAWDPDGKRDEYNCIDIDPFEIFKCPIVPDFPENL